MRADKVAFGYREVSPAEKRRLVRDQFSPIAATYDLADTLLSFGQDARWRRIAVGLLGLRNGDSVLDACGGTAGLARLSARRVGPAGRVVVYDFNRPMIEKGRRRVAADTRPGLISFVLGDAEEVSFPDGSFDAVTIGFGLRNLVRPERGLGEFFRVLRPGGQLMILEFSLPVNRILRALYQWYSFYWMPLAGRLVCGTGASFRYLAESIRVFPGPDELARKIREAGFTGVRFRRLTNGIAVAYLAAKPGTQSCREDRRQASGRGGLGETIPRGGDCSSGKSRRPMGAGRAEDRG